MALESTSEQSAAVPPPSVTTPAIAPGVHHSTAELVGSPAGAAPADPAVAVSSPVVGSAPSVPPPGAEVIVVDPWADATFWQLPWVQNVLPVAMSVLLHLVIIIIGFLTVKAVETVAKTIQEQVIIPEAAIVENQPVGGIPNPGLGGDPNLAAAQDQVQVQAEGWADKKSQTLSESLMGATETDTTDSVFGIGQNTDAGKGGPLKAGTGEGGGPLAPYGLPGGGGGIGPKSPFMGISGNARKVVYICDASGSMVDVFVTVKQELKQAIDVLKPIQSFNVIFFRDVETLALNKANLIPATPSNKRGAFEFADKMYVQAGTEPTNALKLAFQQQADLIYILTDGFDQIDDLQGVVDLIGKLNASKRSKVNCILIGRRQDPMLEKALKDIAAQNGGVFKMKSASEL